MDDKGKPNIRPVDQFKFEKSIEDWSDREILSAQLYYLKSNNELLNRNRSNTSKIVWYIAIFEIVLTILAVFWWIYN